MNDQQGQTQEWPQYQSGNISSQQHTQHPQYDTPPVPNYVSPQQPQWPLQPYPHQPQYDFPQLSQYPPQYAPQWQQQPSQSLPLQDQQPIPPQLTNNRHSKKRIGFITVSAIILTLTFVLGIAFGANLKGSSNSDLSSSTGVPSNRTASSNSLPPTQEVTSPTTPIPTLAQASPAKVGDTISVGGVGCTLVSVNHKPLPGDALTMPKAGTEFIVVNVKLTNNGVSDIDYYSTDFYARSSSGNTTAALFGPPSSYTSNNLLEINGTIAPGNSVQGDVILQIPIGDHNAELLWEPYWGNNSSNNLWNLGL